MNKIIKGITLNHAEMTGTFTKAFANKANNTASEEYKMLRQLRQDGYTITSKTITTKMNKISYKGMTIDWMRQYIENHDNCDKYLDRFNNYVDLQKRSNNGHAAYYGKVKKLFLTDMFPNLTADEIRMEIEAEEAAIRLVEAREAVKNNVVSIPDRVKKSELDTAVNQ